MRYESSADRYSKEPQMTEGEFYAHKNGSVEAFIESKNVTTYLRLDSKGNASATETNKNTGAPRSVEPTKTELSNLNKYKFNQNTANNKIVAQDRIPLYQWYHYVKNNNINLTNGRAMQEATLLTGIDAIKQGETQTNFSQRIGKLASDHERHHNKGQTNCPGYQEF